MSERPDCPNCGSPESMERVVVIPVSQVKRDTLALSFMQDDENVRYLCQDPSCGILVRENELDV